MDEIQGLKEAPDPLQLHDVNSYTGKAPSQVYEDHPEVLVGVPRLGKDLLALMTFYLQLKSLGISFEGRKLDWQFTALAMPPKQVLDLHLRRKMETFGLD